jgi:hypothetical protein
MRLRVALTLLAVLLLMTACSVTRGSGQLATESRPVSGFTRVELSGTGELTIEKTGTESLSISAEDNLLPRLTSEVSGDTLTLGTEPNTSIEPTEPITYSLTVKDLTGLVVSGSGSVRVSNLTTTSLSTKISGSGTITANGAVNDQDLEISGSGRYIADGMTKQDREGTHLRERYRERCRDGCAWVKISGSGTLTYSGDPQITQEISGSGKLIKK